MNPNLKKLIAAARRLARRRWRERGWREQKRINYTARPKITDPLGTVQIVYIDDLPRPQPPAFDPLGLTNLAALEATPSEVQRARREKNHAPKKPTHPNHQRHRTPARRPSALGPANREGHR